MDHLPFYSINLLHKHFYITALSHCGVSCTLHSENKLIIFFSLCFLQLL